MKFGNHTVGWNLVEVKSPNYHCLKSVIARRVECEQPFVMEALHRDCPMGYLSQK